MTAADLGLMVLVFYPAYLVCRGIRISQWNALREDNPDLARLLADAHTDPHQHHPLSLWVARKLDEKRDKKRGESRKPRA